MKRSSLIVPAAAALLALGATGCSLFSAKPTVSVDKTTGAVVVSSPTQTVAAIDKVLYGEWNIINVAGTAVTGETRPYAVFDTTGVNPFQVKVYADNGCNTLNGDLAVTPGGEMRKVSEFLSTMKFCGDAPYELGINMAFETVASFKVEKIGNDYLLYLNSSTGKNLMVLRKCDISFINGAWEVTRLGDKAIPSSQGMKLVIDVPELKIHGNTGCNILNGSIFIDPDKQNSLQFKDLVTTRMTCPNIADEQTLLVALEQIESAALGHDTGTAVLKDAQGKELIALKRLNLK